MNFWKKFMILVASVISGIYSSEVFDSSLLIVSNYIIGFHFLAGSIRLII